MAVMLQPHSNQVGLAHVHPREHSINDLIIGDHHSQRPCGAKTELGHINGCINEVLIRGSLSLASSHCSRENGTVKVCFPTASEKLMLVTVLAKR